MQWIVIKKQFLLAVLLAIIGLGLLIAGWRETPEKPAPAGAPVASLVPPGTSNGAVPGGKPPAAGAGNKAEAVAAGANSSHDGESFFVEYRLDRERTRGEQLALLKEIADNPATGSETRQQAQNRLLSISQNMAREMEVENLIRAKGYRDVAVSLENGGATVIVRAARLSTTDATRIVDLVTRHAGVNMQNIVLIPRP